MRSTAPKRKHQAFSLEEKIWLLDYATAKPKLNGNRLGQALAAHLNKELPADRVPRNAPGASTVNDWKKSELTLRAQMGSDQAAASKRRRGGHCPLLDEALYLWFRAQESRDLTITDELLTEQAKIFGLRAELRVSATFSYSKGWLDKFKKRKGIRSYKLHGEANDADREGVKLAQNNFRKIVLEGGFTADNIFNQDETGLFWRQVPTRTHATGKKAGRKKDKQRVTVSLVCNASGSEKQGLFIIGKAKRPRSFPKSFQPKRDVGIRYANNKTAWMTSQEYSRWVADWNAECSRVDRKIILLGDNAPTHMVNGHDVEQEHGLKVINMTHIKLVFLPANVTSIAQPLDQGIIACAKAHYRRRLVKFLLAEANAPGNADKSLQKLAPNFYQMMCWINSTWLEDVSQDCIVNCWQKAGNLIHTVQNLA
jgi:hypothetical protein